MKNIFFIGVNLALSALFFAVFFFLKISPKIDFPPESPRFFDARGELFFWGLSKNDEYFWKISFDKISPNFINAVVAVEDSRFWSHGGVDFFAIFRAARDNLLAGGIFSGASTITEQLSKKLRGNPPRTFSEKIWEMFFAMRLERHFSKKEIFSAWANFAPFSGNIRGVEAAARIFFQKSARDLNPAEAAFLAAIPQNPNTNFDQILRRQKSILQKMRAKNFLSDAEFRAAISQKIFPKKVFPKNRAPHFVAFLREKFPNKKIIHSSIDLRFQRAAEKIVRENLKILQKNNAKNAAVLAFETKSGAVKIYLGSADFFDKKIDGQVDLLRAFRQVGSTLKPFLYLRAFQKFSWSGETIVRDEPQNFPADFGNFFEPKNYDLAFRGPISVRSAIAESRNVPAVATLEKIGVGDFKTFLRSFGAEFLSQNSENVGLSMALGAAEMRLLSLGKMYGILARGGEDFEFCFFEKCPPQKGRPLLNKNFVLEIIDILADNSARIPAFSENSALKFDFPVAAKTGTTRHFRDNFVVGFTTNFVVLVWVGNADAAEMKNVSGISGAGPIFHQIVAFLADFYPPRDFEKFSPRPFSENKIPKIRILSPLSGSHFSIDPRRDISAQKILFETTAPTDFFLDEQKIYSGKKYFWTPEKGRHFLKIGDATSEFFVD